MRMKPAHRHRGGGGGGARSTPLMGEAEAEITGDVSLRTVDDAFGSNADLYKDVLGVKSSATPEQIQRAYFERRNELFQYLSDFETSTAGGGSTADQDSIAASHRFHAERKMDAVVMAMRILGDPEFRIRYDDIRHERMATRGGGGIAVLAPHDHLEDQISTTDDSGGIEGQAELIITRHSSHMKKKKRTGSQRARSPPPSPGPPPPPARAPRSRDMAYEMQRQDIASARHSSRSRGTRRVVSPEQPQQHQAAAGNHRRSSSSASNFVDGTTDEGTVLSYDASEGGTLATGKKSVVQRIHDEITGVMEDTARTFEQVFNAFTLQEEDILAVRNRIDKAKRQMERSI